MFTGLIEEVGQVLSVDGYDGGSRITVAANRVLADLNLGDSIAVDGVCTTVVEKTAHAFAMEASPETLKKTTFGLLQVNSPVNLERPLTSTSRIGGHFVTGHVDGTALILSKASEGISWVYHFRLLNEWLAPLLIEKGSIAINGISLTINTVEKHIFSVAIIPHTLEHTNIDHCEPDQLVNVETDLLGKYVQRLLFASDRQTKLSIVDPVDYVGNSRIHTGAWFNLDKDRDAHSKPE